MRTVVELVVSWAADGRGSAGGCGGALLGSDIEGAESLISQLH